MSSAAGRAYTMLRQTEWCYSAWLTGTPEQLLFINTVIAKYAGHVRQTFADIRLRAQTLPDILSSRVQYT